MKVFVYEQGNDELGNPLPVAVARPNPQLLAQLGEAEVARMLVPAGVSYQLLDDDAVPADRAFRNAWKLSGATVDVDMGRAVEIHKDRLRTLRAPLLAASDTEFIRAIEAGDKRKQDEIAAKKQALRDVTVDPTIAAARTPEELKAAVPAILKE